MEQTAIGILLNMVAGVEAVFKLCGAFPFGTDPQRPDKMSRLLASRP